MPVGVLSACMSAHAQSLQRSEGDVRSPGTGVVDGYELQCGSWDWNLGPLGEQPEPSLQSLAGGKRELRIKSRQSL